MLNLPPPDFKEALKALEQYTDLLSKQHMTVSTKVSEKSADLLTGIKLAFQTKYKQCKSEEYTSKKEVTRATDQLVKAQKQAMKCERESQSLSQQLHAKISALNQLATQPAQDARTQGQIDASREAMHREVTKLNTKLDKATRYRT
jgi:hypothetical protein